MHRKLPLALITSSIIAATAAGCATDSPDLGGATQAIGACGLGDEVLSVRTYTTADIPALTAIQKAQFVAAFRESAWDDITTVEEAFLHADEHELRATILRDSGTNQFYVQVDYHVGDNPYGAVLYWNTAVVGAAIHDGYPEECGPLTYNSDQGDTAPECAGFLTYVNTASYAALDAYLPSSVAQAIVDARTVAPFTSIASVVAVNGVAETRVQQLLTAARAASFVGASCSGIYDQIATSATEATAIVALANEANAEELHGVLAFEINQTVVGYLIAERPFATAAEVSATYRVGTATFRTLRNAATFRGPFEELVAEVNELNHPDGQVRLDTHFDWLSLVTNPGTGLTDMTCFGIDEELLPTGATVRPTLADGAEVVDDVAAAVATANYQSELDVDPAPGLADLEFRTASSTFFGCHISYHPNPWQYDYQTFFVDTDTGFSVLHTFHSVE